MSDEIIKLPILSGDESLSFENQLPQLLGVLLVFSFCPVMRMSQPRFELGDVFFKIARLALGALVPLHYGCFVCVMLTLTVSSNSQLLCPDSFKTEMGEAF
jgi:hypothetical protein